VALILPKHLQAERDYANRERKIADCKNVIEQLLSRSIRDDLEEIVKRKHPRMPEAHIRAASDTSLWTLADPEAPEMPKYLYMNREDFYDVCDDPSIVNMIESYGLEPIWSDTGDGWDQRPGRITVLTERKYRNRKEIARFHDRADDLEVGILNWV
jgi:hypothetical protein